jgi:hypothetical protein
MRLETDISTIERLARDQEDANWQFRCFLKNCDLVEEEIDTIVHNLYWAISAGALVYVGASHLLPAVEKENNKYRVIALAAGVLVAVIIIMSKG